MPSSWVVNADASPSRSPAAADALANTHAFNTMGDRDRRTSEFMELNNASTAFLLGKEGATKNRLADFTGCTLEIGHSKVGPSQHTL